MQICANTGNIRTRAQRGNMNVNHGEQGRYALARAPRGKMNINAFPAVGVTTHTVLPRAPRGRI